MYLQIHTTLFNLTQTLLLILWRINYCTYIPKIPACNISTIIWHTDKNMNCTCFSSIRCINICITFRQKCLTNKVILYVSVKVTGWPLFIRLWPLKGQLQKPDIVWRFTHFQLIILLIFSILTARWVFLILVIFRLFLFHTSWKHNSHPPNHRELVLWSQIHITLQYLASLFLFGPTYERFWKTWL